MGDTTLFWVILSTLAVYIVALLPMLYGVFHLHPKSFLDLYSYAPQQFFFLVLPFLIAAYCSFYAFKATLDVLKKNQISDTNLIWMSNNWIALMLIGVIIVSLVTVTDYLNTAKVFPTMKPVYAEKAYNAAQKIRTDIEKEITPAAKIEKQALVKKKGQDGFGQIDLKVPLTDQETLVLDDATYLKLAMTSTVQRDWQWLDPTSSVLTTLQLFAALMPAFTLVLSGFLLYMTAKTSPGIDIELPLSLIKYATVAYAIYPICYSYFYAEMSFVTEFESTTRGDFLTVILVIAMTVLTMYMDPKSSDFFKFFMRSLPTLFASTSSVYVSATSTLALRPFIGIDTNPGTRIILNIILLLFVTFVAFSTWPNDSNEPPN